MQVEIVDRPFGLVVAGQLTEALKPPTKLGSQLFFVSPDGLPSLAIGQGDQPLTSDELRSVGGQITQSVKSGGYSELTVILKSLNSQVTTAETVAALLEGILLADYQFSSYKTKITDRPTILRRLGLVLPNETDQGQIKKLIKKTKIFCQATLECRDLVNSPAANLTPTDLMNKAVEIAQKSNLRLTVFGRNELLKMKAGGILGVAAGSGLEPYLLHLVYRGGNKGKIALVGKGVTFDSGGLSLKPAEAMTDMKSDMAGAAVVLAVLSSLNRLNVQYEVHGIIPCVENMISAQATRVGDVLRMYNGQTVEVLNTDAEGRLILADALVYAEEQKVDQIVDLATLTGACIVALGERVAGVMANNQHLQEDLEKSFRDQGEIIWPLPLFAPYLEQIQSEIADLVNVQNGKFAGAIIGGLFLEQFIKETPWAHLDIAGPSFNRKSSDSFQPAGASGFGVRGLLNWLSNANREPLTANPPRTD